ncbi:hypothetical protein QPM17_20940 [Marinobacter sp. TBZ242]|uniref:Uncharacterized protein n=1 Tax=Marinobacter azerbaijanicus TaxID=3050455 RepID=A0ABT7IHK5_9GAMM|nr:hypothetical protein [Marinobacter sp. TBZ242]MDL0433615.1 hypothetical protein [Marinobacter sp. TBZ242]
MSNKDFILQRIRVYAGKEFDPAEDQQVADVLRSRFNIRLPQRSSLNASLALATSDHEIIGLVLQYRTMT